MKKRNLSFVLLLLLCVGAAHAQVKTSSGNEEYWYNLLSAKSGVESQAITENTNAETAEAFPLATVMLNEEDEAQQWKFVKNDTHNSLYIVNRKSGKQIIASSVPQGGANAVLYGTDEEHKGFKVEEIADGQFTISGVEEDGIRRYLAVKALVASDILVLDKANLQNSAFAWVAVQAGSGIHSIEGDVTFKVKNRRIIVENAKSYKVTNLAGVEFPKRAVLEQGIYVVTVGNTSTNVYVK